MMLRFGATVAPDSESESGEMDQENVREAFERSRKALTLRPAIGRGTARTTVRLTDGLACVAKDGRWELAVDMSEKSGGTGAAPDPGVFGRTALGTCLAIGYARWAARRGMVLDGIEVEIQADYDAAGEYGIGDRPPGYGEVRFVVRIETEADEGDVVRLLDEADSHSPWLDVFERPVEVRREVEIRKKEP
jgi:uncharacterized OsmC-like protein